MCIAYHRGFDTKGHVFVHFPKGEDMYYLLDYENIGSLGLKGIDSLTDKDIVCIFYSENAHTIDLEAIEMFKSTKAAVKYIKVKKTAPNYADFQIVTLTGLILGKDSKEKVAIISNDKGYVAVIDYLKEDCVTGTNRIIELASTIADVKGSNRKIENNDLKQNHNFYDINDKRVKNVIKRSSNKGMLKLNLIESFGRIDGLELFNRLEKDFRPKKRV